jgi:hypothetical protein
MAGAMVFATACAPAASTPTPSPTPAAPAAPTVMQTCPTPSDGPTIVVNAVEDAHRALVANPSTPLPPPCVLTAFARLTGPVPDSVETHAIDVASALARRGGNPRDLHESEVLLYARAHRYADASRAYAALAAANPQPAMDVVRAAIVAAHERSDTAGLLRLLTRNASRGDASPAMRAELTILRQVGALHSAINEARGLVRQNPKYLAGYPSLVGNFGTLGQPDSVVAYLRRALGQGATRASLTSALDPLVNTMLRHAALYGAAYGWDAPIAAASRVDSTLSSPSTKFLVASLIAQMVDPEVGEIGALVSGTSYAPRALGGAAPGGASANRAAGCGRIAPLLASLTVAESRMRDGGARYSGGGAAQVSAALAGERTRLTDLQAVCAQS